MADGGDGVDLGIAGLSPGVLVGRGGFGLVYRATQLSSGGVVAVKVLQGHLEEAAVARFEREASALGALRGHPNICTVYDAGVDPEGRPYLVMEYAPSSLADRIAADGPLRWEDAAELGVRMAGAMETAHLAGLLHRDVKPENILLTKYGEWRLADFGLARRGDETLSRDVTATLSHAAPELIEGVAPSVASDVYALGSTLFVALTGKPAFALQPDAHEASVYKRIAEEPVPDMPGTPHDVAEVVRKAMAKVPTDRFASAGEMGVALRQAQERSGVSATPLGIVNEGGEMAWRTEGVPRELAGADPELTADNRTPHKIGDHTEALHRGGRDFPPASDLPDGPASASGRDRRLLLIVPAALAVVAMVVGALALRGGGSSTSTTEPTIITDEVALPSEWRVTEQTREECNGADGPACLDTTDFTFDMTTDCGPIHTGGGGRSLGQDVQGECEVSFLGMEPVPLEWNGLYGGAQVEREDPLPQPTMEYKAECVGQPAYYSMEFWPKSEEVRSGRRVVTEVTGKFYAYFLTIPGSGLGDCGTKYTFSFVMQADE